jgi:hypothetical protein
VQAVRHAVVPQLNGAQFVCTGAGQSPEPSQFAAAVATPAVQDAARHWVDAPAYTHVARVTPSHLPLHVDPSPVQAALGATGAVVTATHWPSFPGTLHASH